MRPYWVLGALEASWTQKNEASRRPRSGSPQEKISHSMNKRMRKNLNPKVWGKTGWSFLKHCAEACDQDSFPRYLEFLKLLPEVLPCEKCRKHAADYLARNPPETGDNLSQWVEDFEANVRARKDAELAAPSEEGAAFTQGYLLLGLVLISLVLALCCISILLCIRSKG